MTLNVQNAKKISIGGSKNLFDKTVATLNSTLTWAYGADYAQTGAITSDYMSTADGTEYSSNYYMLIFCYDADKTYLGYIKSDGSLSKYSDNNAYKHNRTIPSNEGIVYIRIVWRPSVMSGASDSNPSDMTSQNIMLNLGSTALPYEAYVAPSEVRAIHDKDNRLLWGRLEYDTKYEGDAWQQTYTGKNLWGGFGTFSKTISGLNFSTQNDFITVSGTATSRAYSILGSEANQNGIYVVLQSGTYYLSSKETLPTGVTVQAVGTDGTTIRSGSGSFTISQQTNVAIRLMVESGAVITNTLTVYPQLEPGSTATPYEPYVGGIPAPNPDFPQDIKVVQGPQTIMLRGKNKFSLDYYGTFAYGQSGNITQTHTDTSAHMVATGTSGAQYVRTTIDDFDPSKKYTVSCKAKKIVGGIDGQPRLRIFIQYSDDGIRYLSYDSDNIVDPVVGQEYTLSKGFTGHPCYRFYFYNNSSTPVSIGEETEYWDIQIEEGNTTTTFEAFQAKTVSTDLRGVNLMPMKTAVIDDNVRQRRYSLAMPAGTYTVSYDLDSFEMGTNTSFDINFGLYGGDGISYVIDLITQTITSGTTLGRYSKTFTINAPVTDVKQSDVRIAYTRWTNGARVTISNIQIEPGDSASTYQPYHAPYELARLGDYKDYIWKDGTDWKLHKAIGNTALLSTVGSYNSGTNWYYESFVNIGVPDGVRDAGIMSNYFTAADSYNGMQTDRSNGLIATSGTHVVIRNTACTDWSAYRTWLAAHRVAVYYVLATATDTVIADAALIAQLNAMQEWLNRYGYHADVVGDLPIVINQESL